MGTTALELDERLRNTHAVQAGHSDPVAHFVPKRLEASPAPTLLSNTKPEQQMAARSNAGLSDAPDTGKQQNESLISETVVASRVDQLAESMPIAIAPAAPAPPSPPAPPVPPPVSPPVVAPPANGPAVPDLPVVTPVPPVSPEIKPAVEIALARENNAQIWWGRWAAYADPTDPGSTYEARRRPGRSQDIGANSVFVVMRSYASGSQLPVAGGEVNFALSNYEAHTLNNGNLARALVTGASLTMNFESRRFATQLSVAPKNAAAVTMNAEGRIERDGRFYSDGGQLMRVNGGLANRGQQAGYAFERQLDLNTLLLGATAWTR